MATTTYGSPYVQSSDLVSGWPTASQNVADRIDDVALKGNGVNAQTGAGYTLVLTDAGKTVTVSNASAQNLTVPTNASVAFPTGTLIRVVNIGAGTWTLTGTPTINGTTTIPNKGAVQLLKTGTDTWWASALDTAVGGGLTFITSSTFSGSSAVNINNCFTSAYDNYRILVAATQSGAVNLNMRLRVASVDASGATDYSYVLFRGSGGTTLTNDNNTSSWQIDAIGGVGLKVATVEVFGPAVASPTGFTTVAANHSTLAAGMTGGRHGLSTAYDGFSLIPASGTVTGSAYVYGYRKA